MKTRIVAAALGTVLSVTLLIGCSSDDEADNPPDSGPSSTSEPNSSHDNDPGLTLKSPEHQPIMGADEEAVDEAVRAFIPHWAAFSPWDFGNPKKDYFERWQEMATDDYGMQQFRAFDANWSWTWTEEVKAYNASVDRIGDIRIDGDTAVASNVVVTRHLLPVLGRASDDKTETKVYTIRLVVSEDSYPQISGVTSVGPSDSEDSRGD